MKSQDWSNRLCNGIRGRRVETSEKITPEDIRKIYNIQNGLCYWLNIPLDITFSDMLCQPSIDRLDNSKGYTKDNIVLSCLYANLGRNKATVKEFREFIKKFRLRM